MNFSLLYGRAVLIVGWPTFSLYKCMASNLLGRGRMLFPVQHLSCTFSTCKFHLCVVLNLHTYLVLPFVHLYSFKTFTFFTFSSMHPLRPLRNSLKMLNFQILNKKQTFLSARGLGLKRCFLSMLF